MNKNRIRTLNSYKITELNGPIVYWMSRDMRVDDNWAMVYAQHLAQKHQQKLAIVFSLRTNLDQHFGSKRMLDFMLSGLKDVEAQAHKFGIGFFFLQGSPEDTLPKFVETHHASCLITDFSPLATSHKWKSDIADQIEIPFLEVDTHNIVPCWNASNKQEFAAYTFRPKIHKALDEYLEEFPLVKTQTNKWQTEATDWSDIEKNIKVRQDISLTDFKPGSKPAFEILDQFLDHRLQNYSKDRNDPNLTGLSNLSPYLHFGQISAQRVALEVTKWQGDKESKLAFLEELIVRRELSDNFCFYNPDYKFFKGFHSWAQKTLNEHRDDPRDFLYSLEELELAQTHDPAWNAAQREMMITGKMHGYMRMYWAKKILEWTKSPEEALEFAIFLNDFYQLDGRDPNGYTGIAWSIGGVHDRPWFERPVYGKVRYMNANGLKRKFDLQAYINKVKLI